MEPQIQTKAYTIQQRPENRKSEEGVALLPTLMALTLMIIIVTAGVSFLAFNNRELFNKLEFNAYLAFHRREWYRVVSNVLVHGDYIHLGVNMLVLYSFGGVIEYFFELIP